MIKKTINFKCFKTLAITIPLFFTFSSNTFAADDVSIFKNGNGFFIKKLNSQTTENTLTINNPPEALFGTVWFSVKNNTIKSLISTTHPVSEKIKAGNVSEFIIANLGKMAKITFHTGEVFEAKIEKIEKDLLIIMNRGKLMGIGLTNIKMVEFSETPLYEFHKEENKRVIKIEFEKPVKNAEVEMMYMQKNIGWMPTYKIDLINNEKARLVLSANIINDAQDLDKTNIHLVVGVPNFVYSFLQSPMTSNQDLNEFLRVLSNQGNNYGYVNNRYNLNNIATQSAMPYESAERISDSAFREDKIAQQEDLYFYDLPNITLKKGNRTMVDLIKAEIKYEHIYDVELESNRDKVTQSTEELENLPKVWHSIRLNNSTGYPFTTGPAMVIKSDKGFIQPISQDKINYTPVNGKSKLKLTIAPDVSVKDSERETSRKENLKLSDNYYYDLVTVEGKINLKNSKNKNIKLNIDKVIEGELLNTNLKWNVTLLNIYKTQNKVNQIEWEVDLKANEAKEISYKYERYLRR